MYLALFIKKLLVSKGVKISDNFLYIKKQMIWWIIIAKFYICTKILDEKTSIEKDLSSGAILIFLALFV